MYLAKTPAILKPLYRDLEWEAAPGEPPVLYLTFDDGPIPEVTPWVLDTLARFEAKATFFCIGDNVRKHPEVYQQVLSAGHKVGNHSFNHLNGWSTPKETYVQNVAECAKWVQSDLFRPPYGRISRAQIAVLKEHYRVIMWDVLSADFDQKITGERCLTNVTQHARNGSIVVFHDSLKAEKNMRFALPRVLKHFQEKNYQFRSLSAEVLDF